MSDYFLNVADSFSILPAMIRLDQGLTRLLKRLILTVRISSLPELVVWQVIAKAVQSVCNNCGWSQIENSVKVTFFFHAI